MLPGELRPQRGEVILLRGPNGSGKTTLLRALAGLDGPPFAPASDRAAAAVALAPQDARDALVGLTVRGEFRLRGRDAPASLATLATRASAELSSGEARRVTLATCAGAGATLVLLDEPSEGLDVDGREALRALVRDAAGAGAAVVLADHGRAFDDLATRTVELGPAHDAQVPLPAVPRGEGGPILVAGGAVARGRALPALSLGPGFHALRGPNGSGKSTLLLRLAGLLDVDARDVTIAGAPPRPGANVRLLLPHARDALTRERVADECAPHPLVEEALRDRHPMSLSGGEAQRVALAKTLGPDAEGIAAVYLLDEPEAHLDASGRALLVEAIAHRVKRGACVLAATHDEALLLLAQSVTDMPGVER